MPIATDVEGSTSAQDEVYPLCDCQCLAAGRWFSPGRPVSSSNKTERHDITEILLKVALSTIKTTNQPLMIYNLVRTASANGGAGIV